MSLPNTLDSAALAAKLEQGGLNMCALFPTDHLADSMPEFEIPARYGHLLLVGSAGPRLWEAMPAHYLSREHPVDEYSIDCTNNSLGEFLDEGRWLTLFPQLATEDSPLKVPVPLQKLGTLADWHHRSPLGIGINATRGLWFAYRSAIAIDATVLTDPTDAGMKVSSESPCLSCEDTPCLLECPAQALAMDQNPDIAACVQHRVSVDSSCASTCLARIACPVAATFRYSEPQIEYFYNRSRASTMRWIESLE